MVLLHYVTVFSLAIGSISTVWPHPAWENHFIHRPWFFVCDGYVAVSLFFLISGTVLTGAFEASGASVWALTLRRGVRLGVPMAACILLAAFWFWLFPQAHVQAAALYGPNPWLANLGPKRVTLGNIANELIAGGMLLGQQGQTLLPPPLPRWLGLASAQHSFNAPLWTLHLEFYGSLLVLAMVRLRERLSAKAFCWVYSGLLVLLCMHPLGLFLVGYGVARRARRDGWKTWRQTRPARILAVFAIFLGICASSHGFPPGWGREFERISNIIRLPMRLDAFHAYGQYGAILIFFGVLMLPEVQRFLEGGVGRVLGRYSFSLYLVHFPVLFTATSALLVASRDWAGGPLLSVLAGVGATAALTVMFERWVDAPATRWSRRLRDARPFRAATPTFYPSVDDF